MCVEFIEKDIAPDTKKIYIFCGDRRSHYLPIALEEACSEAVSARGLVGVNWEHGFFNSFVEGVEMSSAFVASEIQGVRALLTMSAVEGFVEVKMRLK